MAGYVNPQPERIPVGTVMPFRFEVLIPQSYLKLDGSTYNVDDYPILGQAYGGIAGGTFNLDDWRDIPIWGASGTNPEGTIAGSDTEDVSHTHTTSGTSNTVSDHTHGVGTLANDTVSAHTHTLAHTHQVNPPITQTSGPDTTSPTQLVLGTVASATHTHTVDIPEFTSDAASVTDTGSAGSHTHALSGSTASGGSHSHTTTGTTDSQLSTIDKKPRRAYGWWCIKAV